MWLRATSSTESAMTSRLMSEPFMPSVPIVMPSVIEIVLTSMGVPPAARTPCITFSASFRWFQLQGIVPIQLVGDADLRPLQVLVGEADRLHHGAGGGAIGAFEQGRGSSSEDRRPSLALLRGVESGENLTAGRGVGPVRSPAGEARR